MLFRSPKADENKGSRVGISAPPEVVTHVFPTFDELDVKKVFKDQISDEKLQQQQQQQQQHQQQAAAARAVVAPAAAASTR